MISFKPINEIEEQEIKLIVDDLIMGYAEEDAAFAVTSGCVIARIFDESLGYIFTYPVVCEYVGSQDMALHELSAYCMKEDIPEIISSVDVRDLPGVLIGVRHAELHAMDASGMSFIVEVKNELSMISPDVSFSYDGLNFELVSQKYQEEYEQMVLDSEHNKYYGYNIADDVPTGRGSDMVALARREAERGRSLTLAVTRDGTFLGEGVLFSLDGRGAGEVAFRVAREYVGQGIGLKILGGLIELAANIGLLRLEARVAARNIPSLRIMRSSDFEYQSCDGGVHFFALPLVD